VNPFNGVCLFDFFDICNEQELISGCAYGKKSQLLISAINLHFPEIEASGKKPSH
jgi:hypothetical protein